MQAEILRASGAVPGLWLAKNGVGGGKLFTEEGKYKGYFRGGLGPGTSDLIGWQTVRTRMDDDECKIARFVAIEVKPPGWKPRNAKDKIRLAEQIEFIEKVKRAGGIAGIAHSAQEMLEIVGGTR